MFETFENCLEIPRTIWEFQELFESSENCFSVWRTVWEFQEVPETSENCLKLSKTVWDFRELFKTSENCLRLPRTVQKCPIAVWHFRELCQILRTLHKKPWKRTVALHGHRNCRRKVYQYFFQNTVENNI